MAVVGDIHRKHEPDASDNRVKIWIGVLLEQRTELDRRFRCDPAKLAA